MWLELCIPVLLDCEWLLGNVFHPRFFLGLLGLIPNGYRVGHEGKIVSHFSTGYAMKYANASGDTLPMGEWIPLEKDDIFDSRCLSFQFSCGLRFFDTSIIVFCSGILDEIVHHDSWDATA